MYTVYTQLCNSDSSSDSSSSLDSRSDSEQRRRRRAAANGALQRPSSKPAAKGKEPLRSRKRRDTSTRSRGEERRRDDARPQAPTAKAKSVGVVDLLSSSSSSSFSDSSVGGRYRSFSFSSLTSSSDESSRLPTKAGKKRLMLNDRVIDQNPPRSSGQLLKNDEPASRSQFSSYKNNKTSSKEVVPPSESKRKGVLRQVRRRAGQKQGKLSQSKPVKKVTHSKNTDVDSIQSRNFAAKPDIATQTAPLLISSSSASSSSDSSSASSPRLMPSRKSAAALPTERSTRVHEGKADAFGRYQCRKSASTSATSSPTEKLLSPAQSGPAKASQPLSSSPSPSPRKKRRVETSTLFDVDRVALDDLQAQERELAWIRSHRKQTQARSRPPKLPSRKVKPPEVISVDEQSDANSTTCLEDDRHTSGADVEVKPDKTHFVDVPITALLHPTLYRGIYIDRAPKNILSVRGVPFDSRCDYPLTFYDETETLMSQCAILESFGKPTQCISSVFPSEMAKPQSDVTRAVVALVTAHLPIIRSCHKRKVLAILTEARQKISAYQEALRKHKRQLHEQNGMHCIVVMLLDKSANMYACYNRFAVTSHVLPRISCEKRAARQLKTTQHTCSVSTGDISFRIGRVDGFVHEKSLSALIQVNRVQQIQPLRRYTTSIGIRSNYRVDDDPILRYTAIRRPDSATGSDEASKKYGLKIGNVADEEIIEYVLRLVVGRLGDSEQVFQALKSELDFSQAYTAYSELKKRYDSRQRAKARIDRIEELSHDVIAEPDSEISAIVNLMEQSSLSKRSRAKVLSQRLQPPIENLESSFVDSLVNGATTGMAALGLRTTDSFAELVDVYYGALCRMCYRYACHEHGGDHPLPARRVDPVYPYIRSTKPRDKRGDKSKSFDFSDDEVIFLGSGRNDESEFACTVSDMGRSTGKDADINDDGTELQERQKSLGDPSEFVDHSYLSLVARRMRLFLSKGMACSKLCWKNGNHMKTSSQRTPLCAAELGVIRKLRDTMGDNSCLLAAIVGSTCCIDLHELIKKEPGNSKRSTSDGRSSRRLRSWKHGRRLGGSNHELLQRTRNQRLQDRGTENHEFEGCTCLPGECRTSKCSCFVALRECDPDVCLSCGASEWAVVVANDAFVPSPLICGNVNVIRSKHKRLSMSFSSIHGYGMYAREAIPANDFVYEYMGAMLSQDEAERRGLIYDQMEMSYLFDLNEDAVLDALRSGNKSKFINHDGDSPNCTAKVVSVCGVHHISIWALRDIAVGDELVFDYGYKRSVGPDWSQRLTIPKD
ncbi:unnamed protein product [Phytophthora fragariaefolia]|uniref:Unnamed protein product n=1 Tax=Phytophthora fragariaefolia TaxID=1490495 RepID=A0A9W6Y7W3_9STRA|nr:unnamed protein product [Phytophthora fragariaefolia]